MKHLDLIKLTPLMNLTRGIPEIMVGLIDGPLFKNHPDIASENIIEISDMSGTCALPSSKACLHGTFVAGMLCGRRGSSAPAICPACTFVVRPVFGESSVENGNPPSATPEELAVAIMECIDRGVNVINLSVALAHPSSRGEKELENALNYTAKRGVITVAASGNQGTLGSSVITRHPWVIPVVACDNQGRPMSLSNLGRTIGRLGLCAPGDEVTSLNAEGKSLTLGGTSVAAPFVTGAIALLWSKFPDATASDVKLAVTQASVKRRNTVVPPLLDAWAAYQFYGNQKNI